MARPLRIQASGLTYHITARGVRRTSIYLDDEDRQRFLALLADVVERYALRCHAYCEMTNHYHLAVTTTDPNLSAAVKQLNSDYAQWWNWRHQRSGHVFQARFKGQVIQDDRYLINVCRYIVLNPVRAGMVLSPDDWPWSSYLAMIGAIAPPPCLNGRRLLDLVAPDDPSAGARRFRELVTGETNVPPLPRDAILGDDRFVAEFQARRREASREVPRREGRPSIDTFFQGAVTRAARNRAIVAAYRARFSLVEIARYLEIHPSTVTKIVAAGVRP